MPNMTRTKAATLGLLVPGLMTLGVSADTSYRFLGTALAITNDWERLLLCGVAEALIIALTIYAWATRTKGPAYLAYAAVLVQAVPAFQVGGGPGGIFRVMIGPVALAVILHLLLGLELRMSEEKSDGILGAALREARERLTASLGIGRRGADSAAIARSRAADRAVDLADRVAAATPGSRKHSRRAARLATAIDDARHDLDPVAADAAEAAIVSRVVRRKSVAGLATIATRHDWTATTTTATPRHDTDRDTATAPAATDRDTATTAATPGRDTDRDTATTPVATDRDTDAVPADATPTAPLVPIDIMSKRQEALSLRQSTDLGQNRPVVAPDTAPDAPLPAPAAVSAATTATTDAVPSVAQIVREAMTAGVTDRDMVVSRVQQYRPGTTRATVARAMQRQGSKAQPAVTGQYL
ncbi:hypothetical protein [Streptomyces sp. ISL-100]|uniref:hypothetical protein n=1 Tax=Streptomyces sp. ISL-100 TaxID=2819173 RepID=UPI001BE6DDBF|nr:hypothetical protein [Streptomyces sp. ISL-100]MBT2395942.1 hypothetical protein [Streptomyces sp. ISL-100]